jgi:hypothetical protein
MPMSSPQMTRIFGLLDLGRVLINAPPSNVGYW